MRCPSCAGNVADDVWLCPLCEHILDPSVLGLDDADEPPVRAERTRIVAFAPDPEDPPDAMILGDVDVSAHEFEVVHGPGAQPNGRTSTFLFYTSGATSRIMHPDAVPRRTRRDASVPRTPYEDFILSCIDGTRSVRAIQRTSGLAPQEVVITLLTLLDKGVIQIAEAPGARASSDVPTGEVERSAELRASSRGKSLRPPIQRPAAIEEPTATDDDEPPPFSEDGEMTVDAYSVVPREELEDLPSVRDFEELADDNDTVEPAEAEERAVREALAARAHSDAGAPTQGLVLPDTARDHDAF
ncbi:hypothetical protein L6R52_37775, partial [Myxococcota bacterium]|nr:hypothetical protein [Myxococcota bacterium]